MNKAFEKILERLEEKENESILKAPNTGDFNNPDYQKWMMKSFGFKESIKIVQEVAEEYKDGWIPCIERLPEKNGMYLCTQNSYDLATNKKIIRVSTELVEFYDGKWRRAKNLVITHWQPLPEPFKERD